MERDSYFGKLPAELLGKIAAALPLNEAARTSVLSRRWRSQWWSELPNTHFAGNSTTKFVPGGYPVSCFDTVGEFLSWVDQVIRQREPFPLRRPTRAVRRFRRTDFSIDSLGLNFDPEDPDYGWIEFNKDRSKTTAPLVDGACTCCRSKVVSFLSRRQPHGLSLSRVLSGRRRTELLKHLTLRNCDMDILRAQFQFTIECGSFKCLSSLVVQKGRLIEVRFLAKFIYCCPELRELTLEDCSIVDDSTPTYPGGRLLIMTGTMVRLRLTRCSGFEEIMYLFGQGTRYAYPSAIHQETVEYHFADRVRTPPLPEPPQRPELELEMPPFMRDALLMRKLRLENDVEEEIDMPDEEEVAFNFYDRFDRN
ncbi:unnamed protein product [Linum trigynum]|uniref:F-box domain-containing protein n=1 Tax=Linum trigynum TaxID=586398 RepID=A0AAV2CRN2_9ROSI